MKSYIVAFFLCNFSVALSYAEEDWYSKCDALSGFAETVMEGRQRGVSKTWMMQLAEGDDLLEQLTIQAYDRPRFSTNIKRKRSIEEFREEKFFQCVRSIKQQ